MMSSFTFSVLSDLPEILFFIGVPFFVQLNSIHSSTLLPLF